MAGVKPLLETIGALLPKGIKAWHASPHDFDKVDLSKIGTGQGAASYGPGFYAAESPAVSGVGGEYWKEFARHFTGSGPDKDPVMSHAVQILEHVGGDRAAALKLASEAIGKQTTYPQDQIKAVRDLLASDKQVGPRVYELNLKAEPRSFLQWDEPLKGQPAYGALQSHWDNKIGDPSIIEQRLGLSNKHAPTGEDLHHALSGASRSGEASMIQLQNAGIPGIRYLDEKSRSLGPAHHTVVQNELARVEAQIAELRAKGDNLRASELDQHRARLQRGLDTPRTYNYVVNNPDIIEIMRKLAIPGVATGGAASVYQPQGQQ
jgi:hypothetical protein